jgi:hypothetical protein
MAETLRLTKFKDVDLSDPFFDTLKDQYNEFPEWFAKKAEEPVYVVDAASGNGLIGFLYLKVEEGSVDDVVPPLPPAKRLKVGTLKILAHGTKLGERVVKKAIDKAVNEHVEELYVTVFAEHQPLINLLKRYGFMEGGTKTTPNGQELVLVKKLEAGTGDIEKDYPFITTNGKSIWLLAIYPEWHSNLFPDSLLKSETADVLADVSHTNSIHKVYVAKLSLKRMKRGDIVVAYRTTDRPGQARFRSVATSLCVVEESRSRKDFASAKTFADWAAPHSVFTKKELRDWYSSPDRLYAIKMTYNIAFPKRPIRDLLLEDVGISEQPRWDLRELTSTQLKKIIKLAQVDESLIIN